MSYVNCLAASALLMNLTNAWRPHAPPQTVAILRCISARRVGANVPRDCQTVRVARGPSDDVNEYEEEVERVVGIYAPHLGARHIHITRTTDWRIVPKVPVVEPLTLKSGIAAPRSPVNNCGKLTGGDTSLPAPHLLSTPQQCLIWLMKVLSNGMTRM